MYLRTFRKIAELHSILEKKIPAKLEQVQRLKSQFREVKVDEIRVDQIMRGMRGLATQLSETSHLDPDSGIRFRGLSIEECQSKLPLFKKSSQPMVEGMLWLLLTGEVPSKSQVEVLRKELASRAYLPKHTEDLLKNMPDHLHPMSQLSIGVLSLGASSQFDKAYSSNSKRTDYWKSMLDDGLDLVAKIPRIAAMIYRNSYRNKVTPNPDSNADLAENFGRMLGWNDEGFFDLLRLYLNIHCDHEAGNVSAHTTHLVGSALSDIFKAYSAGLNGLAGPLHGLANQECLHWLMGLWKAVGDTPSSEAIEVYAKTWLNSGKVIPGYGHAVLRIPDPRFISQMSFAKEKLPDNILCNLVSKCSKVIPKVLKEHGKAKNPFPNVDAFSGALLYSYGLRVYDFYTVIFGVSRAIGCSANLVWDRALMFPLEKPESLTINQLSSIKEIN